MYAHLSKHEPEMLRLRLVITFLFVVQFKCVTRRFDRADRMTHLKLFLDQSDVPRKIGSKP